MFPFKILPNEIGSFIGINEKGAERFYEILRLYYRLIRTISAVSGIGRDDPNSYRLLLVKCKNKVGPFKDLLFKTLQTTISQIYMIDF
jgi:hypothetical protein